MKKIKGFRKVLNSKLTLVFFILILFSTDAFAYWDKITNIPAPYSNSKGWLEFWFLKDDPNYGWICGFDGKVIRTTDKGRTWQGSIVPGADQLESITFTDKMTGYVSGTSVWGFGAIYKSIDGGVSWREITDNDRMTQVWGNYFLDKNNGMVIGGGCEGSQMKFFKTSNGGASWSLSQSQASYSGLSDLILYPDGSGYATSSGYIYYTNNGGFDWSVLSQSGGIDWQEDLQIKGQTILVPYSEGCSGNLDNGGIRITTNSGSTWKDLPTGNAMFGAWLHDSQRGWACGHSASLLYTSNGGDSWESRNCGIDPGEVLDDFWFIDDTTGFVCGRSVYKYSIPKKIEAKILNPTQAACDGDTIILAADGTFFHYEWSTGSADSSIIVTQSGTYELAVYNSLCDTIIPASVTIKFFEKPELEILMEGDNIICEGDSLKIWAKTNADRITWSTGDVSDTIIVKTSGTYRISVANEYGCTEESEITIRVVPLPKPTLALNGRRTFCVGDSTTIEATPGFKQYRWYNSMGDQWVTNENWLRIGSSGKYSCIAVNEEDCEGAALDTIEVIVIQDVNRLVFAFPESKEFDMDSTYFPNMICKQMKINNATQKDYSFDLPFLLHNESFSFPLSQFPILLKGGDSVELKVCYSPTKLGIERDSVILEDVCNPHFLVLKGLSLANNFSSNSICNADVIGVTTDLPGKFSISTSEPYPNPASLVVSVPFNESKPKDYSGIGRAELYDVFGNFIQSAERNLIQTVQDKSKIVLIGEFVFNTSEINSGSYLVIIRGEEQTKRYNLSIFK